MKRTIANNRSAGIRLATVLAVSLWATGCVSTSRIELRAEPTVEPGVLREAVVQSTPPDEPVTTTPVDDEQRFGEPWPELGAPRGWNIAARLASADLGGDFDGETFLTGPDTIYLPETDSGVGYELSVGRRNAKTGWYLAVHRNDFAAERAGGSADVRLEGLSINGLRYFRVLDQLQPYVMFGFGVYRAQLERASELAPDRIGDADLGSGAGIRLGTGVSVPLRENLAWDFRFLFTAASFGSAEGVADKRRDIDDGVDATIVEFGIGLHYSF